MATRILEDHLLDYDSGMARDINFELPTWQGMHRLGEHLETLFGTVSGQCEEQVVESPVGPWVLSSVLSIVVHPFLVCHQLRREA
ncbi:MAG: hypothetical protein AAF481_19415 [Acidobacteriota bacterium]